MYKHTKRRMTYTIYTGTHTQYNPLKLYAQNGDNNNIYIPALASILYSIYNSNILLCFALLVVTGAFMLQDVFSSQSVQNPILVKNLAF